MNRPKVLFVDDELITLKSFELYFNGIFDVFTASEGSKAVDLLAEHTDMAALITDYKMPGVSGLQLIRQARSTHPGLVCFLITGYTNTPEILEALSENVIAETITKPFDLPSLEKRIISILD